MRASVTRFQITKSAGITNRVSKVAVAIPPIIGAAMRLMISAPVALPYMMGIRPAKIVATVITLGRTRSRSPSKTATDRSKPIYQISQTPPDSATGRAARMIATSVILRNAMNSISVIVSSVAEAKSIRRTRTRSIYSCCPDQAMESPGGRVSSRLTAARVSATKRPRSRPAMSMKTSPVRRAFSDRIKRHVARGGESGAHRGPVEIRNLVMCNHDDTRVGMTAPWEKTSAPVPCEVFCG